MTKSMTKIFWNIKSELNILGSNFWIISTALTIALFLFFAGAGDLLDVFPLCFEVIYPFFAAVAVGEWGKMRADPCFDVIAAQSPHLFSWAVARCAAVFGAVSFFALLAMTALSFLRPGPPLWELVLLYLPTSFFLSSLGAALGLLSPREHTAALGCGILWLAALLARGLLRLPGVEYIYLFLRFAGDHNRVWLWNKGILTAAGLGIWGIIGQTLSRRR